MKTREQIVLLTRYRNRGYSIELAAALSGMSEKTARNYLKGDRMFEKKPHLWRTRKDPFEHYWADIEKFLLIDDSLEAKTLFEWLQREYPGTFSDGQLRTLQRRIRKWRLHHGGEREIFFTQVHHPGEFGASDFCHTKSLNITINRVPFDHLLYHFVLTYSNWEYVRIAYSETFEALNEGLSSALRHLGGSPKFHRTDRLSCAINNASGHKGCSLATYRGLLDYYSIKAAPTNASSPHENGDIESAHNHFQNCIAQELILRGSSDFSSIEEYDAFLQRVSGRRNLNRRVKVEQELKVLKTLPAKDYYCPTTFKARVSKGSTVHIRGNTYSVPSRFIGYQLDVRLFEHTIELWYSTDKLLELPRLRGTKQAHIDYRHLIHWLVRKPGAFKNYKFHAELFPNTTFRMAYDWLLEHNCLNSSRQYLKILELAATEGEDGVSIAIEDSYEIHGEISFDTVKDTYYQNRNVTLTQRGRVQEVDLTAYDQLLYSKGQPLQ